MSNEDDSSCSSSLTSSVPLTIYRRNQLKTDQWTNECYKKFSTFISSLYLHEECPHDYDENTSKNIYEYWINKRQFNKTYPLIKHIDYVLDQRENSELLITQINTFLNTQKKLHQVIVFFTHIHTYIKRERQKERKKKSISRQICFLIIKAIYLYYNMSKY